MSATYLWTLGGTLVVLGLLLAVFGKRFGSWNDKVSGLGDAENPSVSARWMPVMGAVVGAIGGIVLILAATR